MTYKSQSYTHLLGIEGFSDNLLQQHFALYQGYVANTNKLADLLSAMVKERRTGTPEYAELKRRFGWEFNGMRLHEYYFSNLTKGGTILNPESALFKRLRKECVTYREWEKTFKSVGAMRGIGWVMLCHDPVANRLFNVWIDEHDSGIPVGTIPLLVMDVFEHAYMMDYGMKRADYIEAFFKAIDWRTVRKRLGYQDSATP